MNLSKTKKTIIVVFISLLLAVSVAFIPLGISLGWFVKDAVLGKEVESGTFEVTTKAWFDGSATSSYENPLDLNGLIDVDVRNPNAENYMGKLKVNVKVRSYIDCALRLRISNLWFQGDDVPRLNPIVYTTYKQQVGGTQVPFVIDNTKVDSHYYYCDTSKYTQADYDSGAFKAFAITPGVKEFFFIIGFDEEKRVDYDGTVTLKFQILSELVQANRVSELWPSAPKPAAIA